MGPWPAREPHSCLVVFWSEVPEARGEKAADSKDRADLGCEGAARPSPAAYSVPEQDTVFIHPTYRRVFLL